MSSSSSHSTLWQRDGPGAGYQVRAGVFASRTDAYIEGLVGFREGEVGEWIGRFAAATAQAANLARGYLAEVDELKEGWRAKLQRRSSLRSDAAAWAVIEQLPGHPVITLPVATAVTGRSKSSTAVALEQLVAAGVLLPLSQSRRNRAWEADGLLDLLAGL